MITLRNQSQVLFLYLRTSVHELISAEYQWDCAVIRAYFDKKGIHSTQFIQHQMSTIYELTEEIASLGMQHVIFYVNRKNYWLNQLITRELKYIEVNVLWIGPITDCLDDTVLQHVPVDNLLETHELDAIYKWVLESGKTTANKDEVIDKIEELNDCLPYHQGWIPAESSSSVGLRLSTNSFMTELYTLQSKGVKGSIPILDEDLLENIETLREASTLIVEKMFEFHFQGCVSSELLNEENIIILAKSGFKAIEVRYAVSSDQEDSIKIAELHQQLKQWRERYEITFTIHFMEKKGEKNLNYRFELSRKWVSVWHEMLGENHPYEQAFLNGYISFLSGWYPSDILNGSVKHVGVSADLLNEQQYIMLKEFLSVNSSLIVTNSNVTHQLENQQNDLNLYTEGDSILRKYSPLFEKNRKTAQNAQAVIPHLVQENSTTEGFKFELQIDDFYREENHYIDRRPYTEAGEKEDISSEFRFLTIETEQDLKSFLQDVTHFNNTGTIRMSYQISSFLTDSCRWGVAAGCKLCQLPRFRVGVDEQIMPCGGSKQSIGSIGDGYAKVLQNVGAIAEEEEIVRGCMSCEVRDQCSKCAILPSFMSREQYCSIKKSNLSINWYIGVTSMLQMLSQSSKLLKEVAIDEIKISSKSVSHYLKEEIQSTEYPTAADYIYLISIHKQPFLYNVQTQRVLKINEPMAVMYEAFMKGVSESVLANHLQTSYDISQEQAKLAVDQAIQKFVGAGCLREAALSF